jgi:hypothetical protein
LKANPGVFEVFGESACELFLYVRIFRLFS